MLGKSKLKYIQSLGHKKLRDEEGVFIAEGPKLVNELLLARNVKVREVYALNEWIAGNDSLLKEALAIAITDEELGKISQLATPNQVLAIVEKFPDPHIEAGSKLTLVLDALQDPGNLGTIIRIADWFGISQLVCSPDCADCYNPKVVQATMGSLVRVSLLYTDLAEWLDTQKGIPVYAAVLEGQDVRRMEKIKEGIIIIGNESRGIGPQLLDRADKKMTIPGKGGAESLNAAVAAGIILSHLVE